MIRTDYDSLEKESGEMKPNTFLDEFHLYLMEDVDEAEALRLKDLILKRSAEYCEQYREKLTEEEQKRAERAIFPFIAAYKVLQEEGWEMFRAFRATWKLFLGSCSFAFPFFFHLHEQPDSFAMLRQNNLAFMKGDSLKATIDRDEKDEMFFTVHRCLYNDLCTELGCREVCDIFCDGDYSAMGSVRNIKFIRTGSLGRGDPCCDFHLFRMEK